MAEGVIVGARSSDWIPLPVTETGSLRLMADFRLGVTHVRVGGATSALVRSFGVPAVPYLDLYWRLR